MKLFDSCTEDEKLVIDKMKNESAIHLDALCGPTGYSVSKLSAMLLSLEFGGVIRSLPGKRYELI